MRESINFHKSTRDWQMTHSPVIGHKYIDRVARQDGNISKRCNVRYFCIGLSGLNSDKPTCRFCAFDNCGAIGNPLWSQSLSPRVCLNWPRRKPSRGNWPQFIPICYNNANAASHRLIVIKWFGKHQWCHQIVLSMWKSIINHPESEAFCLGIFK